MCALGRMCVGSWGQWLVIASCVFSTALLSRFEDLSLTGPDYLSGLCDRLKRKLGKSLCALDLSLPQNKYTWHT